MLESRLAASLEREKELFRDSHRRSEELHAEAGGSLIGGVPMPWMTRWPGPFPIFANRAEGGRLFDVDGNQYVDFALGDTGAMVGHAPRFLRDTIASQAGIAVTTMLPSEDATWVAGELRRRFGLPRWQFALTATDANRFALRLARHLTGRSKILVFDWCYHGTVDETLATLDAAGGVVPRAGNIGPSVDPSVTTAVVQFNDVEALEGALQGGEIAAVLTEPALTNIGIVLPDPGFHQALRALTRRHGTLLIIDETHTMCAGPGGYTRAFGLEPDMVTVGKAIAGGIPAAAYGAAEPWATELDRLMRDELIDVSGLGGTLAANAFATAAMRATLSNSLRDEEFAISFDLAKRWADGVAEVIAARTLPWSVQNLGSRSEYWFCPAPRNGAAAAAATNPSLEAYFHLYALNRGVLLTPFHNMALLSPHHTVDDVSLHSEIFAATVASLLD